MGALDADADESVIQLAMLDHRLHRALLDQLDEGLCMLDSNHRILHWNQGAERITGYFAHEVVGQFDHGDLLIPAGSDGSLMPADAARDGRPDQGTVLLRHREGHRLLVHLHAYPIHDARGAVVGVVEVFEEPIAPVVHRRQPLEAFNCSDSSSRAAKRKCGEMMVRHALEAWNTFDIPFGWLRVGLDGAQDLDRGYGHAMVEAAAGMIAATLDRSLPALDFLTRWESAEFRVEVHGCSRSELAAVAERLRLLVSASALEWWGDRLRVTVSIGGATAEPGDTIESLEERVSQVYESCLAGGGDRTAIAHLIRTKVVGTKVVGTQVAGTNAIGSGEQSCSP